MMRKITTIKRFWSVFLLVCLLVSLSSCGGQGNDIASHESDAASDRRQSATEPAGELVIYCPPLEQDISYLLQLAGETFTARFPDVTLTIREFGKYEDPGAVQDYQTLLSTELSAGKGPDVILFDFDLFPDVYKLLDANVFCDITDWLEKDETFDRTQYNQDAFAGGVYKGQQLFLPLSIWQPNAVSTTEEALEQFGVSLPKQPSFADWADCVRQSVAQHSEQENLQMFGQWAPDFTDNQLLWRLGLRVVDYETGEVDIDVPALQKLMELCKALYPYSQEWTDRYPMVVTNPNFPIDTYPIGNALCELNDAILLYMYDQPRLEKEATPITFFLPSATEGKTVALLDVCGAIRSTSPNQKNAYEFLKILLSPAKQHYFMSSSVHMDTFRLETKNLAANYVNPVAALSDVKIDELYAQLQDVTFCQSRSRAVAEIVWNCMTPYFQGHESFDFCLTQLQGQLDIYLHE